ncbi:hypothetical protein ACUR5C_00125 [Aliikangiella sp. IMCC44653]
MKLFKKTKNNDFIIISIDGDNCRLQHLKKDKDSLYQSSFEQFTFKSLDELGKLMVAWCQNNANKGLACRWVISRDYYQTFQIDAPDVAVKEIDAALRWQVKDLIEKPVDEILVSHFFPHNPNDTGPSKQLNAVVVDRSLVESFIEWTKQAGLEMDSIEIEELSLGFGLLNHLQDDKIIGFIGQDQSGLVFSFYQGQSLAFSRYKKGLFLPSQSDDDFTLEDQAQAEQESFLLETQRSLDYVVSQVFRRPVEKILLQSNGAATQKLSELINQITEIEVSEVTLNIAQKDPQMPLPSIPEVGSALRVDN